MTADEIRKMAAEYSAPRPFIRTRFHAGTSVEGLEPPEPIITGGPPADSMLVLMLAEIAAQMAELNKHLETVDKAVFG